MRKLTALFLTTILVFALAACGSEKTDGAQGPIIISGKKWTEQFILPYLLSEYIQAKTDYKVEVEDGLGPTQVLTQAMKDGDIDIYVDYTGTGLLTVLKESLKEGETKDDVYNRVKEGYKEQLNMVWTKPLGFNNSYAFALRAEQAEELGVKTASDLAKVSSQLVFGADPVFYEREDGYDAVVKEYGYSFKDAVDLDTNMKYNALAEKKVDVIDAFTTDGRLPRLNLTVLEDDKNFFPPYDAVPIVRAETLEAYPELENVLNELGGKITEEDMAAMNAKVDIDQAEPQQVAIDFLKEKGLID